MAESQVVKTRLDGTLTFASQATAGGGGFDSAGAVATGSNSYVVSFETGDLSITSPGPQGAVNNFLDRGKLGAQPSLRLGDEAPLTFSFSAYFRDMTDASTETLMDIVNQSGDVDSNWVSTLSTSASADDAEVFTVDLKWDVTNAGDSSDTHLMVLPFCTLNFSVAEGDPNSVTINGTSWATKPSVLL